MTGDNVVKAFFNKKEATKQAIIDGIDSIDFDKLVLIGTKDEGVYISYTGVGNTLELIGLVELLKLNLTEKM